MAEHRSKGEDMTGDRFETTMFGQYDDKFNKQHHPTTKTRHMSKNRNSRRKMEADDNPDERSTSVGRKSRQSKTCFPPIKQQVTEERVIPSRTDSDIREQTNRLFHDPSPQDIELTPQPSSIHHLPSVSSHPMVNFGYDWAELKQHQQKIAKATKKQKAKKMKRSDS